MSISSLSRHRITIESGKTEYTISQIQKNQFDNIDNLLDPEILKLCELSHGKRWCYAVTPMNLNLESYFLNLNGVNIPLAEELKKFKSEDDLFLAAVNISYYYYKLFIERSSPKSSKGYKKRFNLAKEWKKEELIKLGGLKTIEDIYCLNSDSILNIEINIISYLTGLDSNKILENLNIFDKKYEDDATTTYISKSKTIQRKNNLIRKLNTVIRNKKMIETERRKILLRLKEINSIYEEKEDAIEKTCIFHTVSSFKKSPEFISITNELSCIEKRIEELEILNKKFDEKFQELSINIDLIDF